MGYELLPVEGLLHEVGEFLHWAQQRFAGLAALLHRAHNDFVQAFRLHRAAFRVVAVQQGEFVKANLRGLFCEPFHAVHVFRGCHGEADAALPCGLHVQAARDVEIARIARCRRYGGFVEIALAVGRHKRVALLHAQHAHSMRCLFGRQGAFGCHIGGVEETYFFHRCRIMVSFPHCLPCGATRRAGLLPFQSHRASLRRPWPL